MSIVVQWNVESYLQRKERIVRLSGEEEEREKAEKLTVMKILEEARRGRVEDDRVEFLVQGMIGWPGFRDVFSVSAKTGDGVKDLRDYLLGLAQPGQGLVNAVYIFICRILWKNTFYKILIFNA